MYNLKNVKNTHGGVLILVKLLASACNCTKINNPSRVFFTFFKLCKWYQIAQRIIYANEDQSFDSELVIASFNKESLFTNIPLPETIDLCGGMYLRTGLVLIICRKTILVSCLLGACLHHLSLIHMNTVCCLLY